MDQVGDVGVGEVGVTDESYREVEEQYDHDAECDEENHRRLREYADKILALEASNRSLVEVNTMLRLEVVKRDAEINALNEFRKKKADVERLQAKVDALKKNLLAVDARADERAAGRVETAEREARTIAAKAEKERDEAVELATAGVAKANEMLEAVREGGKMRDRLILDALEEIWAFDLRKKGCAKNANDLMQSVKNILCSSSRTAK